MFQSIDTFGHKVSAFAGSIVHTREQDMAKARAIALGAVFSGVFLVSTSSIALAQQKREHYSPQVTSSVSSAIGVVMPPKPMQLAHEAPPYMGVAAPDVSRSGYESDAEPQVAPGYDPDAPLSDPQTPTDPTCGHQDIVGKTIKDIDIPSMGGAVRVLYPGTAGTTDFSPDRINIILEKGTDRIVRVTCG